MEKTWRQIKVQSFYARIWMAGSIESARLFSAQYASKTGLCVTITATTYVYTGGEEFGFFVGFINYPRFPETPEKIKNKAILFAKKLAQYLGQSSFSIEMPQETIWFTRRGEDK